MSDYKQTIYAECMKPDGFAAQIRENKVDEIAFERLKCAIKSYTNVIPEESCIDRLIVGCLFELPWEMENATEHYSAQSRDLGVKVSRMADELREHINELLWIGLEANYQNV